MEGLHGATVGMLAALLQLAEEAVVYLQRKTRKHEPKRLCVVNISCAARICAFAFRWKAQDEGF